MLQKQVAQSAVGDEDQYHPGCVLKKTVSSMCQAARLSTMVSNSFLVGSRHPEEKLPTFSPSQYVTASDQL
jgi:hypothetical protein